MITFGIELGSMGRKPSKRHVSVLAAETGEIQRTSCPTAPDVLLSQFGALRPHRLAVEQSIGTGWSVDLRLGANVPKAQVVNGRDESAMAYERR